MSQSEMPESIASGQSPELREQRGAQFLGEPHQEPRHGDDSGYEENECGSRPPCLAAHLLDNDGIVVDVSVDEFHVLGMRLVEEIDDTANKEGKHAHQHVTQHIVENSEGQGNGA